MRLKVYSWELGTIYFVFTSNAVHKLLHHNPVDKKNYFVFK